MLDLDKNINVKYLCKLSKTNQVKIKIKTVLNNYVFKHLDIFLLGTFILWLILNFLFQCIQNGCVKLK